MNKRLIPAILGVLLTLTAFAPQVDALVLGPLGRNGFPQWIGDGTDAANPGLQLMVCNGPGNHDLGIGPCLAAPGEFIFYAMEVIPVTPPAGVDDLRIIIEIIGAKERDPELGPGLLDIIGADIICRLRGPSVTPGATYTFSTPYGDFPFVADATGRIQEGVTGLHSLGPAFAELLDPALNPIQTFLRADFVQAGGVNPPLGFIGDGVTPMTGAGFTFAVTGPNVNFTSAEAAVQGKIFNEPGATAVLTGGAGTGTPLTVTVTADAGLTTIEPVFGTPRAQRFPPTDAAAGLRVKGANVPARVAVTDGAVPPTNAVVAKVVDTVTVASATTNARGALVIKGVTSNKKPAPKLTVFDADTGTKLGAVRGKIARIPSAKAAGVTNIEVRSAFGGTSGPIAVDAAPAP